MALIAGGVLAVVIVAALLIAAMGGSDDEEPAAASSPTRPALQAPDVPLFNEGDTLQIEDVGRVDRYPTDCIPPGPGIPGTCFDPAPGTEFLVVEIVVVEEGTIVVPSLRDRLEILADEISLEIGDGNTVEDAAVSTFGSLSGTEALELAFEVPADASDFVLNFPGTRPIDLEPLLS